LISSGITFELCYMYLIPTIELARAFTNFVMNRLIIWDPSKSLSIMDCVW